MIWDDVRWTCDCRNRFFISFFRCWQKEIKGGGNITYLLTMSYILKLPKEILIHVFLSIIPARAYPNSPKEYREFNNLALTCKLFHQIFKEDHLWKALHDAYSSGEIPLWIVNIYSKQKYGLWKSLLITRSKINLIIYRILNHNKFRIWCNIPSSPMYRWKLE